jgi:alpha,alpha-trehalase
MQLWLLLMATESAVLQRQRLQAPDIWRSGPILRAVQSAHLFNDSKDFVDSPLLVSPEECWKRFLLLPPPPIPRDALAAFVKETFGPPGHDLEPWTPPDHVQSPPLVAKLPDGPVKDWATALNNLWPVLGRRMSESTLAHPERTTLLPARHGFIVPGGRFREVYYWDSYWVVLGLLACGMRQTATNVTTNLLEAAQAYGGYVPNGLRSYYLNRSQPPLLTQMVAAIVDTLLKDIEGEEQQAKASPTKQMLDELLQDALPVLDAEYAWWMRPNGTNGSRTSAVLVGPSADGSRPSARLNRYVVETGEPRPESWREDVATASHVPAEARAALYAELAAGAETGWDYSSRWLSPTPSHTSTPASSSGGEKPAGRRDGDGDREDSCALCGIRTSKVLPVELNAILYRNERTLARLHALVDPTAPAVAEYAAAAAARLDGMEEWMWSATEGRWEDLLLLNATAEAGEAGGEPQPIVAESAASYMPLWAGACSGEQAASAAAALRSSRLLHPGGVATTLEATGQQWDSPNAWPPLQQMLIEGLSTCGAPLAAELASSLAERWLRSNWLGWNETHSMHEKYDAMRPGKRGGGGEYTPQVGFGWTNGVVLWLLQHGFRFDPSETRS